MKVLQGTARKDRAPKKSKSSAVVWQSKVQMNAEEQQMFDKICSFMQKKKAWQPVYGEQLAHYCRMVSMAAYLSNELGDPQKCIQVFRNNTKNISAELVAYIKACDKMFDIAKVFGFTPSAWEDIQQFQEDPQLQMQFPDPMKKR